MSLSRPSSIIKPFAISGSKNTIPIPTQVGITEGAASYETGFPPATMIDILLGGIAPDGKDMNGVLYELSQQVRFINAGGQPVFNAALAAEIGGYPVGVILQNNAGTISYINVLANNTTDFNTTPAAIGVSWLLYAPINDFLPIGTIIQFAGVNVPTRFLRVPTTATTVSRTTYAELFAAIGVTWGIGNGSTTFGIPYMTEGQAALQANNNVGSMVNGQNIAHTHAFGGNGVWMDLGGTYIANAGGSVINMTQLSATASSGGTANLAAGIKTLYCIKYI